MLNLACWTSVLGNLGAVTARNSVQRCVMQVLVMLYKLWTVLRRSTAVFVCPSCRFFPDCPAPSLPVGSCASVLHTGDRHRLPRIDGGCEHGIQIQILHVEATPSPADLQICAVVLFHLISQGQAPHQNSLKHLQRSFILCCMLWPLFSSKLHKHAFFSSAAAAYGRR